MAGKLRELAARGQSVWFDDVNRDVIQSGRLGDLKQRYSVTGGTSNPTIFERAFADSHAYDEQFRALASRGWAPERIVEDLMLTDVQLAVDLFRDVYDETAGNDGYVSLEVPPALAYDTEGTIRSVKHLFGSLNRPNVMIKIPGTAEGLPAIAECLEAGININITLLFSISNYGEVARAYMSALEKRLEAGYAIDGIASVASFFVSRVDALADSQLADSIEGVVTAQQKDELSSLRGKIAIANAKLAYVRYLDLFRSDRWKRLAAKGARVQRCLWASTGTKNDEYPDTLYVDGLIGPDTISTMPESTLLGFDDHGTVEETLTRDVAEAEDTLRRFEQIGLSLPDLTDELQRVGVSRFVDSYNSALESVKTRSRNVRV